MTKPFLIGVLFLGGLAAAAAQTPAPAPAAPKAAARPQLPDVLVLKQELAKAQMENHRLQALLSTCSMRAMQPMLTALEGEFLKATQAPAGSTWDWSRSDYTPPAAVVKPDTPKAQP